MKAFTVLHNNKLGLVHEGIKGYTPTNYSANTYTEAQELADQLNKSQFGLSDIEALKIVASSF